MDSMGRSSDTTAAASAIYEASYRSLSGSERVERAMEMAEEVKRITLAGIAHRHPDLPPDEIHRQWLRILHGDAFVDMIS